MSIEIEFEEESDLNDLLVDTVFDLTDRCRTCLQDECSLTPTNSSDSDSIKFCDKLASCVLGMMWPKERVPSFICGICIEKLRIAYDFQAVCLQSDRALQLQGETNKIRSSRSATLDPMTTDLAECDETSGEVILSLKCNEMQLQPSPQCAPDTSDIYEIYSSRSTTPDPTTSTDIAECDETLGEVILSLKCNEMQLQPSPQCALDTSDIYEIHSSKSTTPDPTTTTDIAGCDETLGEVVCVKYEKTQPQPSPQRVPDTSSASKMQSPRSATPYPAITTGLTGCEETQLQPLPRCAPDTSVAAQSEAVQTLDNPRKHGCLLCGKELCEHILRRTGEKYIHAANFQRHLCSRTRKIPLACSYCERTFARKHTLDAHLAVHTTGNQVWRCRFCNKSYSKPASLKRHMSTHWRSFL